MTDQHIEYRKRDYLSYSTLLSFARCPRRYMYQKMGIGPRDDAPALSYGTAMHKAIDVATREGLDAAMKAFDSVWEERLADNKRSRQRAREQLAHYVFTHDKNRSIYQRLEAPKITNTSGIDSLKLDESTSPLEIPFAIDIGLSVPLMGRLDGWCRHRDTGDLWGFEFKTTSRLSGGLFDCLELNPQVLTYALVLKTLSGERIRGIMYEAMLIDPKKVDGLTHPVVVQDHHVDGILLWLRYQGELLLACESRYAELLAQGHPQPEEAFVQNFSGCSAYPHFYMPGSHCEFENLCRVPDFRTMVPYYEIRPEHRMVVPTVEGAAT